MQDNEIVDLYWKRDEMAICETESKYGRYLLKIALNILFNIEDSKESVNDTYLRAWNSMPPHKPCVLSTYLGKITRQLSIDTLRRSKSEKRKASEYAISLTELEECVSAGDEAEQMVELHQLAEIICKWLRTLSPESRNTFVGRYFYFDSISEVAAYYGMSESKVKSMLYRSRISLKATLTEEGFDI